MYCTASHHIAGVCSIEPHFSALVVTYSHQSFDIHQNTHGQQLLFCVLMGSVASEFDCDLRVQVYAHADASHLEQLLEAAPSSKRKIVVTDSVFSMDGAQLV